MESRLGFATRMWEVAISEEAKNAAAALLDWTTRLHGDVLLERYPSLSGRLVDDRLATSVAGIEFDNPIMVGGGWDKCGRSAQGLWRLGFSGVEVGTVTPLPQAGNPRPRLWTFGPGHSVAINRMGLNNPGMAGVAANLERRKPFGFPIGINIGKNEKTPVEQAADDYKACAEQLAPYASYVAMNVSCPNTPGGRALQAESYMTDIVQATKEGVKAAGIVRPLFIKISPDLENSQIDKILEIAVAERCAGIIAVNTTTKREGTDTYGRRWATERGGLSGAHLPYQRRATEVVRHIYQQRQEGLGIIGVGGIHDLSSLLERLQAGASVVQVVTGIRSSYGRVAHNLNRDLLKWMNNNRVDNLKDIIGTGN